MSMSFDLGVPQVPQHRLRLRDVFDRLETCDDVVPPRDLLRGEVRHEHVVTCGPGDNGTRHETIHLPGGVTPSSSGRSTPSRRCRACRNHGVWRWVGCGQPSSRRLKVTSASGEKVNRVLPSTSVFST